MGQSFDKYRVLRLLAEASTTRRRLSLSDVLCAGLPAVYRGYGDSLLFVDGTIYDASDPDALEAILHDVANDPALTVGLEFGWLHSATCGCSFCRPRPAQATA